MMLGCGEVTLGAGRATVSLPRIPAGAVVVLSPKSLLGTVGQLTWSVTPRVGFTITSLSVLDLSTVAWVVLA